MNVTCESRGLLFILLVVLLLIGEFRDFFLDFLASKTATGDIGLLLYYIGVLRGPQAFFRFYRYPALATTAIALEGSMWFVPLLGILRDA